MMKLPWQVALMALVLLVPAMAQAQGDSLVKWTYAEAGYMDLDAGSSLNLDLESDGYFIGGSIGFNMVHIIGQYDNTDGDDYEERRYDLGVGWHGLLGARADLYADLAYQRAENKIAAFPSVSESGWLVRGGARWRPIKLFEAEGQLFYQDLGDRNLGAKLRAMIHIWRVAVGLSWTSVDTEIDQSNTAAVFARFNFR
jgi:hypothetical protein